MGRYEIDFKQSQKLEEAMKLLPSQSENLLNQALHTKGTKAMMAAIVNFMPTSNRNKKHAKHSNPLKDNTYNLGFSVFARGGAANNKGSFGYLVFPNEGRGTSNPKAQQFFEQGGEKASDQILIDVMGALEEAHQNLI